MGYGISGIPGFASCVLQHTLMFFCVEGIYFTLSSRRMVFLITTCKQIQAKLIPRSAGYFLQTYLQSYRLQSRPRYWPFEAPADQTQTELIHIGKNKIRIKQPPLSLQLCIDRCPGCHYSQQTTSTNKVFLSSHLLIYCQHRAIKPSLHILELAPSKAGSVYYWVPAPGSNVCRDCAILGNLPAWRVCDCLNSCVI